MLPIIFIVWYNLSIYYFIIFLLLCGLINETINLSKIFVLSIKSLIIKSLIMIMAGSVLLAKIAIINVDYFLYITWLLFILLTLYLFKKNFFSFLLINLILLTCVISVYIFQINNNILLYLIIINSISDVSAYLVGSLIKGPKLIPKISPNKTYSGSIAAIIASVTLSMFFPLSENLIFSIFIGLFISIFGQFGDLLISIYKRKQGFKDSGYIIPGHGGLLDRFDSLMLNMIFIFLLINLNFIS